MNTELLQHAIAIIETKDPVSTGEKHTTHIVRANSHLHILEIKEPWE